MAYEELLVISFGIVLSVVSVALFWAHVKRINAPNKADPEGTRVKINLAVVLEEDEDTRRRRALVKTTACCKGTYGKIPTSTAPTTAGCCVEGAITFGSKLDTPRLKGGVGRKDPTQEPRSLCSTLLVPSAAWAEVMVEHANMKRKLLREMVKVRGEGGRAAGWESALSRLGPERRRKLVEMVREELVHAVSAYVGKDEALFGAVCPDLNVDALQEEWKGQTGLSRLIKQCIEGKLPELRSRAQAAIQAAIVRTAPSGDKRSPVHAFLSTFRKLCAYSFCIGVLEAMQRGKADGSGGPTVASVLTALVKTGASGVLVWLFFHGLAEMSEGVRDAGEELTAVAVGGQGGARGGEEGGFCKTLAAWGMSGVEDDRCSLVWE